MTKKISQAEEVSQTEQPVVEQQEEPQFVAYDIRLVQELLGYLSEKPFKEVTGFMQALQKGQKVQIQK